MASPAMPIADLSYRNYDGPLLPPRMRWLPIAKMVVRLAIKKKAFWWTAALANYWYILLAGVFYFMDTFSVGSRFGEDPVAAFFKTMQWNYQFLDAMARGQVMLFLCALVVGAGSVAADNKANALLVYLSKPCTKKDYILGKWVGMGTLMFLVQAVPMTLFYGYCVLGYREYGVVTQDPFMWFKLILACFLVAAFLSAVMLGISSLFQNTRTAGLLASALFFLTYFATSMFSGIRQGMWRDTEALPLLDKLYHASIDGINVAVIKKCLGTDGSLIPFNAQVRVSVPTPERPGNGFWAIYGGATAVFVLLAWRRVRAVEVVGS